MILIKKGKNLLLFATILAIISFASIIYFPNIKVNAQSPLNCDDGLTITTDYSETPPGDTQPICYHSFVDRPIKACYNKPFANLDRNNDLLNQVNLLMGDSDSLPLKNSNRLVLKTITRESIKTMCGVSKYTRDSVLIEDIPEGDEAIVSCSEKIRDLFLLFTNNQSPNQTFNGIAYDEFITSDGTNYRNYNQAMIAALKMYKQTAPTKMLVGWGPRIFANMHLPENNQIGAFKYLDYIIPEIYFNDRVTEEQIAPSIENTIYGSSDIGLIGIYAELYDTTKADIISRGIAKKKILASFASYNHPYINNYDLDPNSSINEMYDKAFFAVKEKFIANKNANGVAIWDCGRTDVQVASWLADIFDHYFTIGSSTEFSSVSRTLGYVLNGGFESDLTSWNIPPETRDLVDIRTAGQSGLSNPIQFNTAKVPQPSGSINGKLMHFTRGTTANKAEQQLKNLVPGHKYKLELYHFRKPTAELDPNQKYFLESNIETKLKFYNSGVDFSWDFYDKRGFILYEKGLVNGVETRSYNWFIEEFIFTAPANVVDHPLKISISDQYALEGQEHYIDFVQLEDKNTTAEVFGCSQTYNWINANWAKKNGTLQFIVRSTCLKVSGEVVITTDIPPGTTLQSIDKENNIETEIPLDKISIDTSRPGKVRWIFSDLGNSKSFSVKINYLVKVN